MEEEKNMRVLVVPATDLGPRRAFRGRVPPNQLLSPPQN